MATPEADHINAVLADELRRVLGERTDPQSPEVAKYLSAPRVDLGDVHIPLHKRFIERQRRQFVAAINLGRVSAAAQCVDPNPTPVEWLDPIVRANILTALKCHLDLLDIFQSGMHKINQDYEATLRELQLPPFTQEWIQARDHRSTLRQDAELAADYVGQRELLRANVDFFTYLDAHAAHVHYTNNEFRFDDPDEAKALLELQKRLQSAER